MICALASSSAVGDGACCQVVRHFRPAPILELSRSDRKPSKIAPNSHQGEEHTVLIGLWGSTTKKLGHGFEDLIPFSISKVVNVEPVESFLQCL